jgi:hypothetical protein
MDLPVCPFHTPFRTFSAKDLDAIKGFLDSGHDILTVNHDGFHDM